MLEYNFFKNRGLDFSLFGIANADCERSFSLAKSLDHTNTLASKLQSRLVLKSILNSKIEPLFKKFIFKE